MKIISGDRKGHSLLTPKDYATRPTLSRVKESLFGIISGDLPGSYFVDLYAGSGAIGLEALSRGADRATLVENGRDALRCLHANIEKLRYDKEAEIISGDAAKWRWTGNRTPDIVFADPPYKAEIIDKFLRHLNSMDGWNNTLIILQLPKGYQPMLDRLRPLRTETYGATVLHFYLGGAEIS